MSRLLSTALFTVCAVLIVVIMIAFNLIILAYAVDYIRELVLGKFWLVFLIWLFPLMLTFIWWSAIAAGSPLLAGLQGLSEGDSEKGNPWALVVAPLGFVVAFLFWQLSNWLIYGLLDLEPWAYNVFFGWLGLSI